MLYCISPFRVPYKLRSVQSFSVSLMNRMSYIELKINDEILYEIRKRSRRIPHGN